MQIGESMTNILKLLFFTVNLHFVKSKQISTYRKLNFPFPSSLFSLLTCRNAKRTQKDESKLLVLLLFRKETIPRQTLKVAAAKTLFSSVYVIDTTCLDECFLF